MTLARRTESLYKFKLLQFNANVPYRLRVTLWSLLRCRQLHISLLVAAQRLQWARKRPAIRRGCPRPCSGHPSLRIIIGSLSWPLFSLPCEATLPTILKASPSTRFSKQSNTLTSSPQPIAACIKTSPAASNPPFYPLHGSMGGTSHSRLLI